jgi:hypothetical protein
LQFQVELVDQFLGRLVSEGRRQPITIARASAIGYDAD